MLFIRPSNDGRAVLFACRMIFLIYDCIVLKYYNSCWFAAVALICSCELLSSKLALSWEKMLEFGDILPVNFLDLNVPCYVEDIM